MAHLELYVMTDKMCLTALKNEVVDRIRVGASRWSLNAEGLAYVYENTLSGCLLRKLVAHSSGYNLKTFRILRDPARATNSLEQS